MVKMKKQKRTLSVLMNGTVIGKLEKIAAATLTFTYTTDWLGMPGARPLSLSLPLVDTPYTGDVVYHFFDNLLPDNEQIRARIQAKFQAKTNQPFDLLATIGKDCIGAVQLIEGDCPDFKKIIEYEPLTEKEIAAILRDYRQHPLGMNERYENFRISLAGAQEKAAFLYHNHRWSRPLNTTPTSHIFKLPIGTLAYQQLDLSDSCENEWLCSQIATAFELPTAKSEILNFQEIKVLVVERFDRKLSTTGKWIARLPQEDICQALGMSSHLKYQAEGGPGIKSIMKLLLGSQYSTEDRDFFYRAQILFWLLAAIDGHAKNFSIFLAPGGKYHLTPLYDVMSAYPYIAKNELPAKKIKMAMALFGKNTHYYWHNIQRRHFIETAKIANYSEERAVTLLDEMLQKIESVIATVARQLPPHFPKSISQTIFSGMQTMGKRLAG